jgi:glycosyltransferase involved in cell wall biosynthesis
MKVLLLTHSLGPGGAERVVCNLADHWVSQGIEVTVVTMALAASDAYELPAGVKRIVLELEGHSRHPLQALMANVRRIKAVRATLNKEKPDVAVALLSIPSIVLSLASVLRAKCRVVGAERTHPPQLPIGRAWSFLRRLTYRRLDTLVVLTEETRAWIAEHVGHCRTVVIPNGVSVPLPLLNPVILPPPRQSAGSRRLLAVGRLSEEKRFDLLIRVFASLAEKFPEWNLVLVGEGTEREPLERLINSLNLGERVRLVGRVGNISDWYRTADLFVLSSRFEGFPNALLESMAHGVAAVSVDCDTGPRDLIQHHHNGILVSPGDEDGLANALAQLMRDDALRRAYGVRASDVARRFSTEAVMRSWDSVIRGESAH